MSGELLQAMAGIRLTHVPYRGTAPAMTDLLGGQVPVHFDNLPGSIQQIQAGRIRALGVTTAKRVDALPDVPAIAETVPGYEVFVCTAFARPKARRRKWSRNSTERAMPCWRILSWSRAFASLAASRCR